MAGRCGCSSANATGASISAGACVTVSGAGTTASPAVIGVAVDPDSSNNLQCGANGLFAGGVSLESGSTCLEVEGDGSSASPYVADVVVSPNAGNMLGCTDDGLFATPNPYVLQGSAHVFGGAVPADPNYAIETGTFVGTTDGVGHLTIPIFVDLEGILSITFCIGDVPTTPSMAYIDQSTYSPTGFDVVFQNPAGAPIAAGTYRVNYTVIGWYAA